MSVTCDMLLHPELLANEQLVYLIQQRHLRIPNIECMPRDKLLELFHQFCIPYGQRKYKDSGRGKILNRNRRLSPERNFIMETVNGVNTGRKCPSNCERLKPPPDLLSGHIKRIKLDNKDVDICKDINKRKMNIEEVKDSPPCKKGRIPITWP